MTLAVNRCNRHNCPEKSWELISYEFAILINRKYPLDIKIYCFTLIFLISVLNKSFKEIFSLFYLYCMYYKNDKFIDYLNKLKAEG